MRFSQLQSEKHCLCLEELRQSDSFYPVPEHDKVPLGALLERCRSDRLTPARLGVNICALVIAIKKQGQGETVAEQRHGARTPNSGDVQGG